MTGVTAENLLLAWQTLQMTGVTAESRYEAKTIHSDILSNH